MQGAGKNMLYGKQSFGALFLQEAVFGGGARIYISLADILVLTRLFVYAIIIIVEFSDIESSSKPKIDK